MDRRQFVMKRKGRYLAQILDGFEQIIEPRLDRDAAGDVQAFKGLVRLRLDALAHDASDLIELGGGEINGVAQEFRDKLSPVGRP